MTFVFENDSGELWHVSLFEQWEHIAKEMDKKIGKYLDGSAHLDSKESFTTQSIKDIYEDKGTIKYLAKKCPEELIKALKYDLL